MGEMRVVDRRLVHGLGLVYGSDGVKLERPGSAGSLHSASSSFKGVPEIDSEPSGSSQNQSWISSPFVRRMKRRGRSPWRAKRPSHWPRQLASGQARLMGIRAVSRALDPIDARPRVRPAQPTLERSMRFPQRCRTARRVAGTAESFGSCSTVARAALRATATSSVSRSRSAIRSSGR